MPWNSWVSTTPYRQRLHYPQTKRYLVRPENRILLHDLVMEETERAYLQLNPDRFHANAVTDSRAEVAQRMAAYESIVEVACAIIIAGSYWGEEEHKYLWQQMLRRFSAPPGIDSNGLTAWLALRRYPATVLMYAAGIASLCGQRYLNLFAALQTPIRERGQQVFRSSAIELSSAGIMQDGLAEMIPGAGSRTRLSNHLFQVLREPFLSWVSSDVEYESAFNLFEYFMGIVGWKETRKQLPWAPVGRVRWRAPDAFTPSGRTSLGQPRIASIAATLFDGDIQEYERIKTAYDAWALSVTTGWY